MKREDIIKVLEDTKNMIGAYSPFLCDCLKKSFKKNYLDWDMKESIIPEFNRDFADKVIGTDSGLIYAWWDSDDEISRIKFMDYLIDLYKKKL